MVIMMENLSVENHIKMRIALLWIQENHEYKEEKVNIINYVVFNFKI